MKETEQPLDIEKREHKPSRRPLLQPQMMDALADRIVQIIQIDKKYKDKTYSAKRLAQDLHVDSRMISNILGVRFNVNYSSFVNLQRVNEARAILLDKRYNNLTMENISDMVGFSNRQSFYNAFTHFLHMTPREYRLTYGDPTKPQPKKKKKTQKKRRKKQSKKTGKQE